MSYNLFLDDIRDPDNIYPSEKWELARDFKQFKLKIEIDGIPDCISFDNDLGEGIPEGYDILNWMIDSFFVR